MKNTFITYIIFSLTFVSCNKEEFNPNDFIGLYDCEVKARVPNTKSEYLNYKDTVYQDTVEVVKNAEGQLVINFSTLYYDSVNTYLHKQEEKVWDNSRLFNVEFNSDSINISYNTCNCAWNFFSYNGKKIQ